MNEILSRRTLANGMELIVADHSRRVAGDRWLVRLVWQAVIPVAEEFMARLPPEEPEVLAAVRARLGDSITFTLARERNFVADADRAALVAALLHDGLANMLSYLNSPSFPEKLFSRRYGEEKKAWLMERCRGGAAEGGGDDEDQAPADFSACFRDG